MGQRASSKAVGEHSLVSTWMRERSATHCLLSRRWNVGQEDHSLDMDTAIIQPQVISGFR